jgi:hypothetical protein
MLALAVLIVFNRHMDSTKAPTNVLPIRPSVTGAPEETESQKWLRVARAKVRVKMALGATPEIAQLHIREALHHLRGLGEG